MVYNERLTARVRTALRGMKSDVYVGPGGVMTDAPLRTWLSKGLTFIAGLPPKETETSPFPIDDRSPSQKKDIMTAMEIGKEVAALCRQGKKQEAIDRFYSPNIFGLEARRHAGHGTDAKGDREDQGEESVVG